MSKKLNLKRKLRLSVSAVAVSCILLASIVITMVNWQKFWQLHTEKQVYFTSYSATQINSWLDEHLRKILFVSQVADLINQSPSSRQNLLNSVIESNSAIEDIAIIDPKLSFIAGQNQTFAPHYAYALDEEALQTVLYSGREFIDIHQESGDPNDSYLTTIYPLRDSQGRINGLLKARLNLNYLRYLVSNLTFGRTGYSYILAPQNRIVAHNSHLSEDDLKNVKLEHDYLFILRNRSHPGIHRGLKGSRVKASSKKIEFLNWFLVVELPVREIIQNMHRSIIMVILTGILGVLLAFAISRGFYNKIHRSLDCLTTAAEELSQGKLGTRIDHVSDDELGEVATAFNSMTFHLQTQFDEIEKKLRFESILAKITSAVVGYDDAHGKISIQRIQELCSHYLGASRSVVYLYDEANDLFTGNYEWYLNPRLDRVQRERISYKSSAFPYFIPVLKMNQNVCLGLMDGEKTMSQFLPEIASELAEPDRKCNTTELYKYIQNNQLVYMIGLPIFDDDKFMGKITFAFEKYPIDIDSWKNHNLVTLKNVISTSLLSIKQRRHLVEEHERLLTTLYSIGDAVIATDAEGKITLMNPIAEKLTGWTQDEAFDQALENVFAVLHPETREPLSNPVQKVFQLQTRIELIPNSILVSRDGTEHIISDSAAPITDDLKHILGCVLVFRDETESFKMQQEILKIQRLEAVSLLAAGIAHDFNNLLTALMGNLSLAKDMVPHYSDAAKIIALAENSAEKGQDITNQLLVYAKGGVPERKISQVTKLIKETTHFLLKGSKIEHSINIDPELKSVHMAEGIFNQILTNIILNAKHALDQDGKIEVNASNVVVDESFNLPLTPGPYVLISIQDNGMGIAPEDLPRIFDPYFTTRNTGSGLGLTSVLSLLKKHEGHITLESKPGQGTAVKLYFQAISTPDPEKATPAPNPDVYRILCYENDEVFQDILKKSLAHLPLELICTSSMVDLLEWFKISWSGNKAFNCVLMDLNTHNRDYLLTVTKELQSINPEVKLILASEFDDNISALRKLGITYSIQKPYRLKALRELFETVIEDLKKA